VETDWPREGAREDWLGSCHSGLSRVMAVKGDWHGQLGGRERAGEEGRTSQE
jgi:hypothetical protein